MFCMSEQEKYEQVGRVAEEYSHLKGKLNHVAEKLTLAQSAYQIAAQSFQAIKVENGKAVVAAPQWGNQQRPLEHLLSSAELAEVLTERDRLVAEVAGAAARLKALAPHLLP